MVGTITNYTVRPKETFYDIARKFDLGIVEILAANPGIDPWLPEAGTKLILPTMHILPASTHNGIVISLPELRLFFFQDGQTVMTFPIGIGKEGWQTPTGSTTIVKKRKDPAWIPPDSIRAESPNLPDIIPPGPDNPLGDYAMNLGWDGYLIHGTNRPGGIGRRSSHGCIRLYPEDIEMLFNAIKEGTHVTVIDAPYKLGWRNDALFLEVLQTQQQIDMVANYKQPEIIDIPEIYGAVSKAAGAGASIYWHAVRDAVMWRSGIPVAVAVRHSSSSQ